MRYENGESCTAIGRDYGISGTRVAQIVEIQHEQQQRFSDPLFRFLLEAGGQIDISGRQTAVRVYNIVTQKFGCAEPKDLLDHSLSDFAAARNMGVNGIAMLGIAMEKARR